MEQPAQNTPQSFWALYYLGAFHFGQLFLAPAFSAFFSSLFFMMGQAKRSQRRYPFAKRATSCRLNSVKMSDVDDVETFDAVESGASLVFPMQAGSVRKGGFMVIKGRPTKVREAANPEEKPRREDRLFLFSRQSGAVREVRGNPAWVRSETWQVTVLASINGRTGRARSCGARGGRECAFSVGACSISSFAFLNF